MLRRIGLIFIAIMILIVSAGCVSLPEKDTTKIYENMNNREKRKEELRKKSQVSKERTDALLSEEIEALKNAIGKKSMD